MDAPLREQLAAAAERADSTSLLVSEGPLTPMPQPSFSIVVPSPPAPSRGGFGWLIHAVRHITNEPDLTVAALRTPNYEGTLNYLLILLDEDNLASEVPDVPRESYTALRRAATEQLKLYDRPLATGAPPSPGSAAVWATDIAGAPRVDRQWAYNGTHCARLGAGKISVLFWLDNLLSALRGEYSIHDGKQQGLFLRQLVEGPVLNQLTQDRGTTGASPRRGAGRGHLR
jgi:hypothetical protein